MVNANSTGAQTGSIGKVVVDSNLILRITQWVINPTASETAWGDSDSGGYTNRASARKDATGSFTAKFDTSKKNYTIFMPGDIVKVILWETATTYWALTRALIQGATYTFDPDSKEVVEVSTDFGSDGAYHRPGEAGAPVETLPAS